MRGTAGRLSVTAMELKTLLPKVTALTGKDKSAYTPWVARMMAVFRAANIHTFVATPRPRPADTDQAMQALWDDTNQELYDILLVTTEGVANRMVMEHGLGGAAGRHWSLAGTEGEVPGQGRGARGRPHGGAHGHAHRRAAGRR